MPIADFVVQLSIGIAMLFVLALLLSRSGDEDATSFRDASKRKA